MGSRHLALQGLNHVLMQLLIFNTPWKEFRVEGRYEALCAQEKTGKTDFQIVRYFQKLILWDQFLYLLISRKAIKSIMVLTVSLDLEKVHETGRDFLEKYGLDCMCFPFTKNHIYTHPAPLVLWSSFSELFEVLSPQATVLILPQIKLNFQLSHCAFFKNWQLEPEGWWLKVPNTTLLPHHYWPMRRKSCTLQLLPQMLPLKALPWKSLESLNFFEHELPDLLAWHLQ